MFKSQAIIIMSFFIILAGCNDSSSENKKSKKTNEFIGEWFLDCHDSVSGTYSYTEELYITDYREFENSDCSGIVLRDEYLVASITYGGKITTKSGVEATEIDIIFIIEGEEYPALGLLYRDGDQLYVGNDNGDLRSTDVMFDAPLTLK